MAPNSKPKILLLYPKKVTDNYMDLSKNVEWFTGKPGGMLILSLATIAALTPSEFEVTIIDENIEPINFDKNYDIVGIGGFTAQFFRAREIAKEFRKRGLKENILMEQSKDRSKAGQQN